MSNKSKIGGALGLLAGVPLLAQAVGWTITAIAVASLIALAVVLYRKMVGDGTSDEDTSS
jgi:hypothetical protein